MGDFDALEEIAEQLVTRQTGKPPNKTGGPQRHRHLSLLTKIRMAQAATMRGRKGKPKPGRLTAATTREATR